MAWDTTSLNVAANAVATQATLTAGLFSGDPNDAGVEVTGGSPAYARKALTFASASGGIATASADFDIPAGADFDFVGIYDAATFKVGALITEQSYSSQGTFTLTVNVQAA